MTNIKNECPSCGAIISLNDSSCQFCGNVFKNKKKSVSKINYFVDKSIDRENYYYAIFFNDKFNQNNFKDLNNIADFLENNEYDLSYIGAIINENGLIERLDGLNRFININYINLRNNKISNISEFNIESIKKIWFNSIGSATYFLPKIYIDDSNELDTNHSYTFHNTFILYLGGNFFNDSILRLLSLDYLPIDYIHNQNRLIQSLFEDAIEMKLDEFKYSEKSSELQNKFKRFEDYLIWIYEQPSYPNKKITILESTLSYLGYNLFVTDINPFKEGIDDGFSIGYASFEDGRERIYYKKTDHNNPIHNLELFEKKYDLDLTYFKNKCRSQNEIENDQKNDEILIKKSKNSGGCIIPIIIFTILLIIGIIGRDK